MRTLADVMLQMTAYAMSQNKDFVMFETNTGSCGGFGGLSDSFGAAMCVCSLYPRLTCVLTPLLEVGVLVRLLRDFSLKDTHDTPGTDWALQMAFVNFTNALYHFGGQNVAYNREKNCPSQWIIFADFSIQPLLLLPVLLIPKCGRPMLSVSYSLIQDTTDISLYLDYSFLMVAEALGPSNRSQVVDLALNSNSVFTPGYAIYENGNPTKVVLINYMADPSGNSDLTVTVAIGGKSGQPAANLSTVSVRRLSAAT